MGINGGTPRLEPWERRDDESEQAYEAFLVYRDMGLDRGQVRTAEKLGKSESLISGWSARHQWVNRCLHWDRHVARKVEERLIIEAAEARKRVAGIGDALLSKAAQRLVNMTPQEADRLTFQQLSMLARVGSDLSLKARQGDLEEADSRPFQVNVNVTRLVQPEAPAEPEKTA